MKKKILVSIGTRPNFIKITQFRKIADRYKDQIELKILHTGQHFDNKMSRIFFDQFDLQPDFIIDLESRSPTSQMGEIMMKMERFCEEYDPDLLMTPGDVNSTLAAALVANKLGIKLAHIESGLRSKDRKMPEEINRILTDEISDLLFVTEQSGVDNLKLSGKSDDQILFVGNTMIDTLVAFSDKIDQSDILTRLDVSEGSYALMTMHRPSNVDSIEGLNNLIETITTIGKRMKIVFPIHPRTLNMTRQYHLEEKLTSIQQLLLLEPLGYFAFQKLVKNAAVVVTDSGGIQEETTYYKIPCLTLRENTERPSTLEIGTNELIEFNSSIIEQKIKTIQNGKFDEGEIPKFWDGKATERIFEHLHNLL
ncbi:UDP-N-acetylglucosamine 2-epimerase (non-hydrolyzing) [Crocinitomix catalasitica]|nr:UDP-N-acetylglucosamine 2-epimerase (non-hydrolyzing) [Crocinitomix catalasitica]